MDERLNGFKREFFALKQIGSIKTVGVEKLIENLIQTIEQQQENNKILDKTVERLQKEVHIHEYRQKEKDEEIERLQKEVDYFLMKYDNTGAIFNRQTMQLKIEEQTKEIERLKKESKKAFRDGYEKAINNYCIEPNKTQ